MHDTNTYHRHRQQHVIDHNNIKTITLIPCIVHFDSFFAKVLFFHFPVCRHLFMPINEWFVKMKENEKKHLWDQKKLFFWLRFRSGVK